MLHHAELNLPEREGKHYVGTNRGNAITCVKVPCDDELWVTTFAEKLAIFSFTIHSVRAFEWISSVSRDPTFHVEP